MTPFEYYREVFKGRLIADENVFDQLWQDAGLLIHSMTFGRAITKVKAGDPVTLARCIAVEEYAKLEGSGAYAIGVKSETVDGYSVTYANDNSSGSPMDAHVAKKISSFLMPTGLMDRSVGG